MWNSDGEVRPFRLLFWSFRVADQREKAFEFRLVVCCVPEFLPWYLDD